MLLESVAVVVTSVLLVAVAYPDLEPDTCLLMDPFDSALPCNTSMPYELTTSKTGVIHNQDSVIFTIKAKEPRIEFRQFIVQARDNQSGVAVGKFVDLGNAEIQIVNCFLGYDNTALEFDQEPKTEARMRWMPDDTYTGWVTFYATVIESEKKFWLRQKTESLQVYNPW